MIFEVIYTSVDYRPNAMFIVYIKSKIKPTNKVRG